MLSVAFWEAFCFFRIVSGTAMSLWVGTLGLLVFSSMFVYNICTTYDERAIVLVVSRLVVVEEAGAQV